MFYRRVAVLTAAVAIATAACTGAASPSTGGAATTAPSAQGSASAPASASASAAACTVGVSWNNFQQPRWAATDKPMMQKTIEAGGGKFIDKDANLNNLQQLTDVDTLIQQGANVLVILAQDNKAILPALTKAKDAGIPVIAYDRLIEDSGVLYITFDNVGVGKAEAEAIMTKVPKGNYVVIKGDPGDANASTFLRGGYDDAGLKAKVDSGDITILAEQFTDGWKTEKAQANMEAIIDKAKSDGKEIQAVLAENDSTALGVVAAFKSKNAPIVPISGQDGDPANLNNVAKGLQYVDVWKNSNVLGQMAGAAALQLCAGKTLDAITVPDGLDSKVATPAGSKATDFTTPGKNTVKSFIFTPTPLTAENLNLVIEGGWITKDKLCAGVDPATAPAACK
jgi:D-xylose transport system substrate-binding protein